MYNFVKEKSASWLSLCTNHYTGNCTCCSWGLELLQDCRAGHLQADDLLTGWSRSPSPLRCNWQWSFEAHSCPLCILMLMLMDTGVVLSNRSLRRMPQACVCLLTGTLTSGYWCWSVSRKWSRSASEQHRSPGLEQRAGKIMPPNTVVHSSSDLFTQSPIQLRA